MNFDDQSLVRREDWQGRASTATPARHVPRVDLKTISLRTLCMANFKPNRMEFGEFGDRNSRGKLHARDKRNSVIYKRSSIITIAIIMILLLLIPSSKSESKRSNSVIDISTKIVSEKCRGMEIASND